MFHTDFNLTVCGANAILRGHCGSILWQSTKLNVHQSVIATKLPNLMSAKCTTYSYGM